MYANQLMYVRGKLEEARKNRGDIAKLSRAVELDRRTVLSVLDTEHNPNVETVDKLEKYFRRIDWEAEWGKK